MGRLLTLGPCPTCNKTFETRDRKVFCSMVCYHRSDRFKAIVSERAEKQKSVRVTRNCPNCEKEIWIKPSSPKKFCCNPCRREYLAARHDRWVANPESIALPQAYDEFLSQSEIRCIVDGCEWTGKSLGHHVNLMHGITADKFKEMAGFNRRTGLVTTDTARRLSDRPYWHLRTDEEKARWLSAQAIMAANLSTRHRAVHRLEGREAARKSMAERRLSECHTIHCERCGENVVVYGIRTAAKACPSCRAEHTKGVIKRRADRSRRTVTCSACASVFLGTSLQAQKSEGGRSVACSLTCRSTLSNAARPDKERRVRAKNVPERGPCAACGKTFHHYAKLKYCSLSCYHATPGFKAMVSRNLEKINAPRRISA